LPHVWQLLGGVIDATVASMPTSGSLMPAMQLEMK